MLHKLGDSFRMLAISSSLLSDIRKDNMAGNLHKGFRVICTPSRPVTTLLFGDQLAKELKEIKEKNTTGDKLVLAYTKGTRPGETGITLMESQLHPDADNSSPRGGLQRLPLPT